MGASLKVYLADIVSKRFSFEILEDRMRELENLVQTYGGVVILKKLQRKDHPDVKTYIGKGKLDEVIQEMFRLGSNLLIIGNILKPSQLYQIKEKLTEARKEQGIEEEIEVRDRVDLILKIFGKHAQGMEARLQIELAAIKHMGPRIYGMGMELSRQGGGSKLARGQGETNTEIMKRHLQEKRMKIKKKLEEYEKMRKLHRESRQKRGLPTVGIVGYTNAGKSSLLNALTKKGALAENKLFATLGTNVGKLFVMTNPEIGQGKEILLNDTIGFIRDLPPQLIEAFSSTLEDSIESDILLHVIDASDPFVQERIQVVEEVLKEIGAHQPQMMVFNKIDLFSKEQLDKIKHKFSGLDTVWISAHKEIGLEELKEQIVDQLGKVGK